MQPVNFEQAVAAILRRDRRYAASAYFFLKEALDFTLKRAAEGSRGEARHVAGPELAEGFRDHALEQFGPMASTLMREWGVHGCADIGEMVFLLIEDGVFGKQDSDSKEDFCGLFDLTESLTGPYLPKRVRNLAGSAGH